MTQSPFLFMKENSKTVLWNDSADPKELKDALTWGIVGATCNPVIALSDAMTTATIYAHVSNEQAETASLSFATAFNNG